MYHPTTIPMYHPTTIPMYHPTTIPMYHPTTYQCTILLPYQCTILLHTNVPSYYHTNVPSYYIPMYHPTTIPMYHPTTHSFLFFFFFYNPLMVKSRTIAKQRLDKYYNLAKEKGYRARSAFKLLQLNKKYNFLQHAHILIDLCAAPGGWLQVAAQEMPRPRKIIGIDLDPIKYIGDVESFTCDITTDECRKRLYNTLEDRQADVILHDGAPNVGTSWESDAFNQNLLVFYSLQLSSVFLKEGGTFVTKIFRSDDYDSLIRVLTKMFRKVEATKPLSSRSQSAEIFVVCLQYRGINGFNEDVLEYDNVFVQRKQEDDYDDYKYTKIKFTEYIRSDDNDILEKITEIENDLPHKLCDDELLYLIKDIKIIGNNDKRKIRQFKKQIIKNVLSGKIQDPIFEFIKEQAQVEQIEEDEEDIEMVTLTTEEKLTEIERELRRKNKNKINKEELVHTDMFYDDDLFLNMEIGVDGSGAGGSGAGGVNGSGSGAGGVNGSGSEASGVNGSGVDINDNTNKDTKENTIADTSGNTNKDTKENTIADTSDNTVKDTSDNTKDNTRDSDTIEVESCSDSLDVDEDEVLCIARYKENPQDFIESTVDRYMTDRDEKLPNYLREDQYKHGRPNKNNEEKLTKKEKEALLRRKTRAERRAEKFMKDLIVEESDEERLIAKETYKREYKRTKQKARIVFAKKGSGGIPRGKGRLVYFDKRLKADKRNK